MKKLPVFIVILFVLFFGLSLSSYSQEIFFDDFNSGADPAWGNERGNWEATGGVYYASEPNNNPLVYSSVTTLPALADFTLEVDINDVDDGGVWLRSDYNGGSVNGVILIIGGDRGTYNGLYWHVVQNGSPGPALNRGPVPGIQGSDIHLKIAVKGATFSAFVNGNTTPVTTLTSDTFASGSVGLYDYSIFGPGDQSFDNFSISLNPPIPDIKANGEDGPLTIAPGDSLSVRISLDTGSKLGDNADWWVLVQLPSGGWYNWKKTSGWKPGLSVTYQGALFDVASYRVLNTSSLTTPGLYKFYFAVDLNMNGSIDMDQIYYDLVKVNIIP